MTEIKKPEKLCKDCKYFKQISIFKYCIYEAQSILYYSNIDGTPVYRGKRDVHNTRDGYTDFRGKIFEGDCGPEGKLWERKLSLKESVINFFKRG